MSKMGLSISYDRVMFISTDAANSVCSRFEQDGVVCPPKLREDLFTTGALDNIDHNPSATTAKESFHGMAISLVQHPTSDNCGKERSVKCNRREHCQAEKGTRSARLLYECAAGRS